MAQSSSDCSLSFAVRHPLFGCSVSAHVASNPVSQEGNFLSRVQSQPDSNDLVSFSGCGGWRYKTVSSTHSQGPTWNVSSWPPLCLRSLCCVFRPTTHFPHARCSHRGIPARLSGFSQSSVVSKDTASFEVTAQMPIPPRLVGSIILVQSSSVSDLSVIFPQMSLVFASSY